MLTDHLLGIKCSHEGMRGQQLVLSRIRSIDTIFEPHSNPHCLGLMGDVVLFFHLSV